MEEIKCYCGHTNLCDCGPEEVFGETFEDNVEKWRHRVEVIPTEEILANRSNAYEFIKFPNLVDDYSKEDMISFASWILKRNLDQLKEPTTLTSIVTSSNENLLKEWEEQFKKK